MLSNSTIKQGIILLGKDDNKAGADRVIQMRVDSRGVYASENGLKMLTQMVKDSGLFNDTGEDTPRNFVIRILESMGILDEDNIRKIVRFMVKETEVFPKAVADMIADKEKK